jgi:adenine-specific DNA-methyltransferase
MSTAKMKTAQTATDEPEKLDLRSFDIPGEKRAQFLALFPEARTEGSKVDFDRLKLALGETVDVGRERYGMNWPGKADCFRTIQTPSVGTLLPAPNESVNFNNAENVIIKGDNLEVLKLLQKSYLGKIKMIYIDPPYNTGNDFIYPDNYGESLETYLEYTGQVDAEGKKFSTNAETDGRFHSKWLSMMYPRLYLARNLLRNDGVIFVSIDDHEVRNLALMLNELYGESNFVAQIVVQSNPRGRQSELIATSHEYVLAFAKDIECVQLSGQSLSDTQLEDFKHTLPDGRRYRLRGLRHRGNESRRVDRPDMYFPLYVNPLTRAVSHEQSTEFSEKVVPKKSNGVDGRWEWGPETARRRLNLLEGVFVEGRNEWDIYQREFLESEDGERRRTKWKSLWIEKEINYQNGKNELKELLGECPLDYPKPLALLEKLVEGATAGDDLVLDFFAGSGTTAHAVATVNALDGGQRRFILVQLPEATGHKDYKTIADITIERARRVIAKLNEDASQKLPLAADSSEKGGFRVFELGTSNFTAWDAEAARDVIALSEQLALHVDHIRQSRTDGDILYELLLKSGFPLTTPVENKTVEGKTVYSVAGGTLVICLDRALTLDLIRAIADMKPERVVCLDEGFAGNDQLKTNAVQTFKTKGITSFKTV